MQLCIKIEMLKFIDLISYSLIVNFDKIDILIRNWELELFEVLMLRMWF